MPFLFGVYRKSSDGRAAARVPIGGLVSAVILAFAISATPVAATDIRLGDDRLSMQVDPQVSRTTPFDGASPSEVGLESMLRAQATTPGPDVAVQLGHYGAARAGDQAYEIDQHVGVHGKLSNLLTLPAHRIAADISGGYRVGELAAFDTGTLETTFTLRARPLARLSAQTEFGWWGQRPATDRTWTQGGHGRLGLTYVLPGFGTVGAFERLDVSGRRGHARSYETGVQLDFGPHTFSLSQRLDAIGRVPAGPPATAAAYGWEVGPLGLALSADYTAASDTAPATGFAGLAVTFGLAGPGPGALLEALR